MSPGTRLLAGDMNPTILPSALIPVTRLSLIACPPPSGTLTRTVRPVSRSCQKTSAWPFVSPGTRLGAREVKAAYRPWRLRNGRDWSEEDRRLMDEIRKKEADQP